jgi:hypothetical protein
VRTKLAKRAVREIGWWLNGEDELRRHTVVTDGGDETEEGKNEPRRRLGLLKNE